MSTASRRHAPTRDGVMEASAPKGTHHRIHPPRRSAVVRQAAALLLVQHSVGATGECARPPWRSGEGRHSRVPGHAAGGRLLRRDGGLYRPATLTTSPQPPSGVRLWTHSGRPQARSPRCTGAGGMLPRSLPAAASVPADPPPTGGDPRAVERRDDAAPVSLVAFSIRERQSTRTCRVTGSRPGLRDRVSTLWRASPVEGHATFLAGTRRSDRCAEPGATATTTETCWWTAVARKQGCIATGETMI
jgi:hypothetical protein